MISVIIPVFNAVNFLEQCIESVLCCSEVGEILIIDDGSTDGSFELAVNISNTNHIVKLFHHENRQNKGAGVSRNLGLSNAKMKYIAFLDADDRYLPNRFKKSLPIIINNEDVHGVYEVITAHYYSESSKKLHIDRMNKSKVNINNKILPIENTGIENYIKSDKLFYHLLRCDQGWIHLNGLLLKSSILSDFQLFNNNIIGEDSDFILRLSFNYKLVGTNSILPVASRGLHFDNRITNPEILNSNEYKINYNQWWEKVKEKKGDWKLKKYLLLRMTEGINPFKRVLFILKKVLC